MHTPEARPRLDGTTWPSMALDGVVTEAGFLGPAGGRVFAVVTSSEAPSAGVVVCSPIGAEATRNYRREVALARRLATTGIACIRFHYLGSGHSDGDSIGTIESMRAGAELAAAELRTRIGSSPIGLVGTRLGSTVALLLAEQMGSTPLVLWEPVIDVNEYFREVLFVRVFNSFKSPGQGTAPSSDPLGDLRKAGTLDVVGYSITEELAQSVRRHAIGDRPVPPSGPVLVIDFRRNGVLHPLTAQLIERWLQGGVEVGSYIVASQEPWWFGATGNDARVSVAVGGADAIDVSAQFLEHRLTG